MLLATGFDPSTIITAATIAIVGPAIVVAGNARQTRRAKQQEWDREDLLEQRREKHDKELAEANAATAAAALAATTLVAKSLGGTTSTLQQVLDITKVTHALVNSDLTAARQKELDAAKSDAASLEKYINLLTEKGSAPEQSDLDVLQVKHQRIGELEIILADRHAHQADIDAQSAAAQAETAQTDKSALPPEGPLL